ncbi:M48 family metalloprotease [Streptomyces sp900105245]|uniref:M48 family metalloprotease n=1 Tax=Streptomyces sp. 900105245 TaxID=3154379 RepID=A0ABV1UEF2_9ACTN
MHLGETLRRHAVPAVVAAIAAAVAVATEVQGPHPLLAVHGAVIAGCLWVLDGRDAQDRAVAAGARAQSLGWDYLLRPGRGVEVGSPLRAAMAERMRQTQHYVAAFAARHQLQCVSLALPYNPSRDFGEARSARRGDRGHVWLGLRWFHPDHTQHLPAVLEHELAHLAHRDTRTSLTLETTALTVTVLAAGLLPAAQTTAVAAAEWLAVIAVRWAQELAWDAQAVRACGRDAVTRMWSADLQVARDTRRPFARTVHAVRCTHRHPPLHLRRWFARHAPLRLSAAGHPLDSSHANGPLHVRRVR